MLPRVIPTKFLSFAIDFVAVSSNPVSSEINQFPHLKMNPILTFDAPFQLGERCADGRQRQCRTGYERVTLAQRINMSTIAGDVVKRRAHAPAGLSSSAPRPDCRRNSRRCS